MGMALEMGMARDGYGCGIGSGSGTGWVLGRAMGRGKGTGTVLPSRPVNTKDSIGPRSGGGGTKSLF